jgi:hypothetical protein
VNLEYRLQALSSRLTGRILPLHVTVAPGGATRRMARGRGVVVELVVTGPLWGAGHAHGWRVGRGRR